ncbi:M24 family metallopeptidase [Paenibacillus mesophilus]|uniref:M24 family metallopeptidase n=1 Tax=Paenibacillus mesophilus TaxID=2582849 RepID=UPI0013052B54|nr:Xaa-Pro peptidase family protein [Paenibacillus mesophilus]
MGGNQFEERIKKLRKLLEQTQYDAVIVATAANLFYFTGVWIEAHERLLTLAIRRTGEPVLVAPDLHRGELESVGLHTAFWRDGEDASALLSDALGASEAVSVDEGWPSGHLLELMKHRPETRWTGGAHLLGKLRQVKDEHEIKLIRESADALNRVMTAFVPHIREGRSEAELLEELQLLWKREGIRELSFDPTVATGANGANPHHTPGEAVVRKGDFVIVDTGGKLNHYCSDMTRTFSIGEPSDEQRTVYELVKEAHLAGIRAVRPGVTFSEIDRAVRSIIEAGGYGEYFVHRTGHGLGIDIHEQPTVQGGNELAIEPGMVFSIEPGVYLPGKFGVRIEDIVIATEEGCESVNGSVSKQLTML